MSDSDTLNTMARLRREWPHQVKIKHYARMVRVGTMPTLDKIPGRGVIYETWLKSRGGGRVFAFKDAADLAAFKAAHSIKDKPSVATRHT